MWHTITPESRMEAAREAIVTQIQGKACPNAQVSVMIGDAGHRIAEYAQEIGADTIVIPCKGESPIKRLLIGSVAEQVVRLAHCPVVVLRH